MITKSLKAFTATLGGQSSGYVLIHKTGGSVDQVDAAEKLIRAFIRERYADNPCPPLLMEPGLYRTSIPLSEEKIFGLMRSYDNQVIMEAQTGTWLEIELDDVTSNPTGIVIYGSYESQVHKAVDLITKIISAVSFSFVTSPVNFSFELQYEPIPKEAIWFLCQEYPASRKHDRGEAEERPPSKKQGTMNLGVGNETMDMECGMVT
uniref:uncharacterized protein LOC122583198 n=1 Tax=Erigeron canadensis TaxID=72917 RepID=UPI001CB9C1DA|nr:uncharacterized protein LOC122583198 [Erigeron canadensis]